MGGAKGTLIGLSLDTGDELWRFSGPEVLAGVHAPPVVAGRQVLFVSAGGWIYALLTPADAASRGLETSPLSG